MAINSTGPDMAVQCSEQDLDSVSSYDTFSQVDPCSTASCCFSILPFRLARCMAARLSNCTWQHCARSSQLISCILANAALEHACKRADQLLLLQVLAKMENTLFCLVLPGDAQSTRRLSEVFMGGSIPVFIGPPYHSMPFSDFIDYKYGLVTQCLGFSVSAGAMQCLPSIISGILCACSCFQTDLLTYMHGSGAAHAAHMEPAAVLISQILDTCGQGGGHLLQCVGVQLLAVARHLSMETPQGPEAHLSTGMLPLIPASS